MQDGVAGDGAIVFVAAYARTGGDSGAASASGVACRRGADVISDETDLLTSLHVDSTPRASCALPLDHVSGHGHGHCRGFAHLRDDHKFHDLFQGGGRILAGWLFEGVMRIMQAVRSVNNQQTDAWVTQRYGDACFLAGLNTSLKHRT